MDDLLKTFNVKPIEATDPSLEDGELTDDDCGTKSDQAVSKDKENAEMKIKLERG